MNISFLKPILGDDLFKQVSEKLKSATGFELANIADGTYIPKAKFDEKITELETTQRQITALQGQLTEAQQKAAGLDGLNQQIAKLTKDVADRESQIDGLRLTYDVKDALRSMHAKNADVVLKQLKMDAIKRGQDGKITGLLEQVDALKKTDGYLFDEQPGTRGGFSGNQDTGAGSGPNAAMNAAIRTMSGRM